MTLPDRVHLREVGPRDGFQNGPERSRPTIKIALIERLAAAGVTRLEATSVRARRRDPAARRRGRGAACRHACRTRSRSRS